MTGSIKSWLLSGYVKCVPWVDLPVSCPLPGVKLKSEKAPLFSSDPGWLPAIEMTGEGVFLRLSEDRLKELGNSK